MNKTKILILGAGFGGAYVLNYLKNTLGNRKDIDITVIDESNYFLFTPMLHEVATGSIGTHNLSVPIRDFLPKNGYFELGVVENVDLLTKTVTTNVKSYDYDYLVMSLGSKPHYYGIEGAKDYTYSLKTMGDAIRLRNRFINCVEKAISLGDVPTSRCDFALVGAGPTGIELACEMAELFYGTYVKQYNLSWLKDHISITIVNSGDKVLAQFDSKIQNNALKRLNDLGVHVLFNKKVTKVTEGKLYFDSGEPLSADTLIWTAGVTPATPNFSHDGVELIKGCIKVEPTLQVCGFNNVFSLGDMAYCLDPATGSPVPMLAQVASRQAKVVAHNIGSLINEGSLVDFKFKSQGMLVSLGNWMAMGQIKGVVLSGGFAWWIWRTIYISKFLSWPRRIKVAVDWALQLVFNRDISSD